MMTPWYPPEIKSVRPGVYDTKHWVYGRELRRWHNNQWMAIDAPIICNWSVQNATYWRGFTEEQK